MILAGTSVLTSSGQPTSTVTYRKHALSCPAVRVAKEGFLDASVDENFCVLDQPLLGSARVHSFLCYSA